MAHLTFGPWPHYDNACDREDRAMATAKSVELKALGGGAMTAPLGALAARFEQATGHRISIKFAATPDLIKLATSGAPLDLAVVPVDVMKNEAARAAFAAGPLTPIARVGFGVAVRAGSAKPDIGTPEKFKAALLAAPSIATLPESAAGSYVLKVFDRLGITEALKTKIKAQASPAAIPQAVASGEADLAVFLTNVLMAPGVELAGPFPGDLQQELQFVGAIAADTAQADAATAFLDFLKTPDAAAVFRARGVTPG
jgi:molybdate transport system substrate-binding protein